MRAREALRGDTATLLRRALLTLAGLGILVTAFELAAARHWEDAVQLVPWAALLVVALATALVGLRPSRGRILAGRAAGAVVLGAALFGVIQHVLANHESGPLDGDFGARWEAVGVLERVWWAFTQTVGPSPRSRPPCWHSSRCSCCSRHCATRDSRAAAPAIDPRLLAAPRALAQRHPEASSGSPSSGRVLRRHRPGASRRSAA